MQTLKDQENPEKKELVPKLLDAEKPNRNQTSTDNETPPVPVKAYGIVIFWMENGEPMARTLSQSQLGEALAFAESLRKCRTAGENIAFVCISSELEASVGQPGVSDKLPEGYDWTKQNRAGMPRRR